MGTGLKSFQDRLLQMPDRVRDAVMPEVIEGAEESAALMRRLAPVLDGDLVKSVAVTGPGQPTPPYSQPGGSAVVPENAAAITAGNSDVRYPHLVEYGSKHGAAQPFFWPAFRVMRGQVVGKITLAFRAAVRGQK